MIKLLYLIIVIVFYPSTAYCYIDPGTGSMLFSGVIGIISILFFAFKSLVARIGTLIFSHHKNRIKTDPGWNKFVFYSEGGQYWNVFKPVVDEMIKRKQRILYYTSDKHDPGLDYTSEYVKSLFIGKGNRAYARLNMLTADICLMTTPGLDVFQLRRSRGVKHYCHILHSPVDTTLYQLFSFDYFDSMLLTGEFQTEAVRHLEKKRGTPKKDLYVVGCTYLDVLNQKSGVLKDKKGRAFTVLVSPSWGPNGILKKFGMALLRSLAESGFDIIIRPHPQSLTSEKSTINALKNNLSGYKNVEWDYSRENLQAMIRSDVMISDFSGIIFDYIFLFSKPIIYTKFDFDKRGYDLSDATSEVWTFKILKEIGAEITEDNFKDAPSIVNDISNNRDISGKIQKAKNTAYPFQGQAGFKSAEALFGIREKLTNGVTSASVSTGK